MTTFQVGSLRCHTLDAGPLWLDGGAMFGVVPRPLWERRIAPDPRNRIPMTMRCLLIEHPDGLVLLDTGAGNKEDARFLDMYGIDNGGSPGPTRLEDSIRAAGHQPDDIRLVINTHLHFDHAGGNSRAEPGHAPALAFPRATYVVQRGELDFARHTNERTRASYFPPNFDPVDAAGRWRLIEGDAEIVSGIRACVTPGHVPWHQVILVRDRGETAAFVADLLPTSAHIPLPWIMGYDVEPLRTLESKRAFLRQALAGSWRIVFEHDAQVAWGWLAEGEKGLVLRDAAPA
jgi:glyoxylase-like metal-dependent hydrolase (beta-lactamase superfamily II)